MPWSLKKAGMFTLGCPVDQQSFIAILGIRSLADIPNLRLYRLKEKCLRFKFKIQYLPGKVNKPRTVCLECQVARKT